jgi:hypothetical protein
MEKEKSKAKSKTLSLDTELMAYLQFTEADLETNRDGQYGQEQIGRLRAKSALWLALTIGPLLLVLVVVGYGVYFFKDGQSTILRLTLNMFCNISIALLGVVLTLFSLRKYRAYAADLWTENIEAVQGRVKLEIQDIGNCKLSINDLEFGITQAALLAFKNGDPYCLYYAPHSKTLLSAEWLRED